MKVYKFTNILNESLDEDKYDKMLKDFKLMNDGNIDLENMTEKITEFLSISNNKDEFLENYDKNFKNDIKLHNDKSKVKKLKPSQQEIYLDHALYRLIAKDSERDQILDGKLHVDDMIVSSDNHIIDGHHKWVSSYLLNPKCKMQFTRIELPIKYALPLIIALIISKDKKSLMGDHYKDYSLNMYSALKWSKEKLSKKINSLIENDIKDENKKGDDNWNDADSFYEYIQDKLKINNALKYMIKNMKKMPKTNEMFGKREETPQILEQDLKDLL